MDPNRARAPPDRERHDGVRLTRWDSDEGVALAPAAARTQKPQTVAQVMAAAAAKARADASRARNTTKVRATTKAAATALRADAPLAGQDEADALARLQAIEETIDVSKGILKDLENKIADAQAILAHYEAAIAAAQLRFDGADDGKVPTEPYESEEEDDDIPDKKPVDEMPWDEDPEDEKPNPEAKAVSAVDSYAEPAVDAVPFDVAGMIDDYGENAMERMVRVVFDSKANKAETLGEIATREHLKTLRSGGWLDDNVIREYLLRVAERGQRPDYPSVFPLGLHFYERWKYGGYEAVIAWHDKLLQRLGQDTIFDFDYIVVPIHLGAHWALVIVEVDARRLTYYDSMCKSKDRAAKVLKRVRKYLMQELEIKTLVQTNKEDWTLVYSKTFPQQDNGSDCGVFACMAAEYVTRTMEKQDWRFSQKHMQRQRLNMLWDILHRELQRTPTIY